MIPGILRGLAALVLIGCASSHTIDPCAARRVFACEPDDGADWIEGHAYELEPSISTCALCRIAELAFEERASELGCCEPFPLDGCPLEAEGPFEGCFRWQAEMHAAFVEGSISCRQLVERAGTTRNWAGFECGGRFCYVPPYADGTTEEARIYCGGR